MTPSELADDVLQKVIKGLELAPNQNCTIQHSGRYLVISGNGRPRWIVPIQPRFGLSVLTQWQPYSVLSRFKWKILCLLYWLKIAKFFPGVECITSANGDILNMLDTGTEVLPVIYIGTPGVQQKAVATWVDINNAKPLAVMKIALSTGATSSLHHEASTLRQLAEFDVLNVPQLLREDEERHRTWQTVLSGRPTARKLTQYHLKWLLALPKAGSTTTLDKQGKILRDRFELVQYHMSPSHRSMLENSIGFIKGCGEIPLVLVHGDFAPWNIKQEADGSLLVMDWEDAILAGMPLWDICHFHYMQAHLFNEKSPIRSLKSSEKINQYLCDLRIKKPAKTTLILFYCLSQIITGENLSEEYRDFILSELPELCDT